MTSTRRWLMHSMRRSTTCWFACSPREGTLRFAGSAREVARMIVSSLEGAMLVARPFRAAASRLLEGLAVPPGQPPM